MYGLIYMITNKITGKKYVGQTTRSLSERFLDHKTESRNRHISNAIKKWGVENFTVEELVSCFDKESLNNSEIYFVEKYNTMFPYGYNHRAGGNQNGKCSDELRKKISLAKTGKANLKRRGVPISEKQKIQISRKFGIFGVKATNLITGEVKIYKTVNSTREDGHNPSNVSSICRKTSYRTHSKNWTFEYIKNTDANQTGSSLSNNIEHGQRLGLETAKAE